MQLDNRPSLRTALAAASCGLLGIASGAAGASDPTQVESAMLYYSEKDRVKVTALSAIATIPLREDEFFTITPTVDVITGASPNGASPTNTSQSFGSYTTAAGQLPLKQFSDQRYAVSMAWQYPIDRLNRSVIGAVISTEKDYGSVGVNYSRIRDLNKKLTTLTMGLSGSLDSVSPSGGVIPDGLTPISFTASTSTISSTSNSNSSSSSSSSSTPGSNTDTNPNPNPNPTPNSTPNPVFTAAVDNALVHTTTRASGVVIGGGSGGGSGGSATPQDVRDKQVLDGLVGVTQVINRRTLMQFNYGLGISNGYLTDPYKIISMVDGTSGETTGYVTEKRPDFRLRQSLYWKTVVHLPHDVVHLSYRYYQDNWGVKSNTAELNYHFKFGDSGYYLEPQLRYYHQSAANFYHHSLVDGATLPQYASADYRLAQMDSTTYGLKLAKPFGKEGEISLRGMYMKQTGVSHPADAIGVQRGQNLYPGLDVAIIQLGLNFKY